MNLRNIKWRKWNNLLHRDIGYLCVGMTLIYCISGIAVNHVRDWNPSYSVESVTVNIGRIDTGDTISQSEVNDILKRLDEKRHFKGFHKPTEDKLQIFVQGANIDVDLRNGNVQTEKVSTRFLIRETNYLHLNEPKKLWTWFADLYAVALAFLAISGMFVLKGKNGIKGRGWWLTAIGFALPVLFLVAYY